MTLSPRMTVVIAIAAVAVCALLAILKRATEITPRGSLVVTLYRPYTHKAGLAWQADHMLPYDLEKLQPYADSPDVERENSPIVIYEDNKPMGSPHSNFAEISKLGHGHYTYWIGQGLFFSTSDGSDPNRNGRRYWAVIP